MSLGTNVSLVVSTDDGPGVATGTLHERTSNELALMLDVDVVLAPGEAAVAVLHDEPDEVVLVVGMTADDLSDHLRVRVVQRRN